MAPSPYCPSCRAIRAPNARFCHMCGRSYEEGGRPAQSAAPVAGPAGRAEVEVSIGTSVKFGIGFAVGASLVGFVFWLIALAGLGSILRLA